MLPSFVPVDQRKAFLESCRSLCVSQAEDDPGMSEDTLKFFVAGMLSGNALVRCSLQHKAGFCATALQKRA